MSIFLIEGISACEPRGERCNIDLFNLGLIMIKDPNKDLKIELPWLDNISQSI